jgi:Na+/alanine symporter
MSSVDASVRVRASVLQILAAALLIAAALGMPWATSEDLTSRTTTSFRAGAVGVTLVVLGAAAIALALVRIGRGSTLVARTLAVIACAAAAVSFALALNRIKSANDFVHHGASHTSYALGSVLGVTAACVLALVSLGTLSRRTQ